MLPLILPALPLHYFETAPRFAVPIHTFARQPAKRKALKKMRKASQKRNRR